jgi:META domain
MRMSGMLRWWSMSALAAVAIGMAAVVPAHAQTFPFDQEMLLETRPLPGSRRVPMIEVHPNGKASVDMWCHSAVAEIAITGNEIKFTFVSAKPENCTPERIELDQKMAKELLEITHWRRKNDIVEFVGPTTFRFRISTH